MNTTAPIHVPNDADVAAAIERSKREILDDIRAGHVPATVKDFSELHDYTDANEYGGLCDSDMNDGPDWTPSDDYATDDEIEAAQRAGNRVQSAVNAWILTGFGAYGAEVHGAVELLAADAAVIVDEPIETDDGDYRVLLAGEYLIRDYVDGQRIAVHLTRDISDAFAEYRDAADGDDTFAEYHGVDASEEWIDVVWIGALAYGVEFAEDVILT